MDRLPDELLRIVLAYMPWKDRVRCGAVCRNWLDVRRSVHIWDDVSEPLLWRGMFAACQHNDLGAAQRLAEQYGFSAQNARRCNNDLLAMSCGYGHLDVAIWLADRFELTACDGMNEALRRAFAGGHIPVVEWLITRFNMGTADIVDDIAHALRRACAGGVLKFVRWFAEKFGAGGIAAESFVDSCGGGHLETAQWIAAQLGDRVGGVVAGAALCRACSGGHLGVAAWLATEFAITDAEAINNALLVA